MAMARNAKYRIIEMKVKKVGKSYLKVKKKESFFRTLSKRGGGFNRNPKVLR